MKREFPILEYDHNPVAVLQPRNLYKPVAHSGRAVLCFFREVLDSLKERGLLELVAESPCEIGPVLTYTLLHNGQKVLVQHPGVGAPLCAGTLDMIIAMGSDKIIACGGAGVLKKEIASGHLIVPSRAVRDEGTSYHYLPPAREIEINPLAIRAINRTLRKHKVPFLDGKTWTTDAIFRETPVMVARRRDEGCIAVEMECAAFAAVAAFRGVVFGQILYGGDDVSRDEWDAREWNSKTSVREKLFWLAVEAALEL